ncbi:phosphotransferase system, mannose fructose-specific component IIA [Lactobacillus pasteurii DSM 23907 = CRBIP 24.76]|uniref:Phosphotransferase system, mannose/fructose-specific component IIA n=1 Tax=Lactobacillus pasteurii DSM 23907 = CRBIP 24.76 TaxID=1423790 RepID=I7JXD7_9LACO|nr:PTS fructose transporter subunit IIA [Lactobacillus pasteurii]KRK07826.1 phosphotransferase system, mannose fructose-specific component IIA [Lactobacillus pasteurii DSM 23907 = CRBIP 24.76]TDG77451.1 hypothetical protein C5L33_000894 [Lactobacillus pasteurii]CCI84525.1 Phosphotransferase system, mannose/fructose-specific component IIA [Lactobacillus pasteurii DSM 23907 = CRBIP 24.76]
MPTELVLISHGHLADEMKKSCEMIMGSQDHIRTVALLPEDSQESFYERFKETTKDINDQEILVFADLMGGTPANTIYKAIASGANIHLMTGMNLAMIIEWVNSQILSQESDYLDAARNGLVDVNELVKSLNN